MAYLLDSWRLPKVLGVMLLGLWAGRRLAAGLLDDAALLKRVALAGLALGLPASAIYAALGGLEQDAMLPGIAAQAAYALGVVPLGLAYAALFALAWRRRPDRLRLLVAPGRMALSNYLGQSLICIALFYGVGLGLIGQLAPGAFYAAGVVIFVGQALLSTLWLRRYPQGPMEALWRRMTYGRRAGHGRGLKRSAAPAQAAEGFWLWIHSRILARSTSIGRSPSTSTWRWKAFTSKRSPSACSASSRSSRMANWPIL